MVLGRFTAFGILLFALLFPVKVPCGAANQGCLPAPDDQGQLRSPFHIEPLTIMLLEQVLNIDIPISYYQGSDPA